MDHLGGLSGTPRHRILTGRIRARTRDRQLHIWPTPRGRESASVRECDSRLGTPDKTPGDLFSSERASAASALRSGTSGGVVGLRTREARLRPGGAYAIPPADTPPHSSPSTPRRPRLSRARSCGGRPFVLWRRLSLGDGQGPGRGKRKLALGKISAISGKVGSCLRSKYDPVPPTNGRISYRSRFDHLHRPG